jgi:hypothetical protein
MRLDNPCPGQSVCQHSTQQAEFKCACDPAEGYVDVPLDGGFCLKMHYLRDVTVIDTDFSVNHIYVHMYVCVHDCGCASGWRFLPQDALFT